MAIKYGYFPITLLGLEQSASNALSIWFPEETSRNYQVFQRRPVMQKPRVAARGTCHSESDQSILIKICHTGQTLLRVLHIILNDAKRVDPVVLNRFLEP